MGERWLRRVEDGLGAVAGFALVAMVLLMGLEVVSRYVLASPLSWSAGLVADYLMVGFFFLGLPVTVRESAHVAVDVVYQRLPAALRPWADRLGAAVGLVFVAGVAAGGLLLTADAVAGGYVPPRGSADLSWPVWTSTVLVPIGALVAGVRLVSSFATGTPVAGGETDAGTDAETGTEAGTGTDAGRVR